jgi:homopolymeric O-antigen transport system permease protein
MATDIETEERLVPIIPDEASDAEPSPRHHQTVIEPSAPLFRLNLHELWRYRDLLQLLVWRDLSSQYRQSVVGFGWALFKPIFSLAIFVFVFGYVAGISVEGLPYSVFCLSGMVLWSYFATSLTLSTASVVTNGGLLSKVYFPRLILPLTSLLSGLVEFAIQLAVLFVLMAYFQIWPGWGLLLLPFLILACMASVLSVSLWLTALNVRFRDVGQIVPYFVQMGMWLTPIVYPLSKLPARIRPFAALNPMAGIIEMFRWAILGTSAPDWTSIGVSFAVVALLLVSGLYYFRRVEKTFADVI